MLRVVVALEPQCPLNGHHVTPGRDEAGGIEVPQVMQADALEPRVPKRLAPPVTHRVLMRGRVACPLEQPRAAVPECNVSREHRHQLVRNVDGALGPVLGEPDLHLTGTGPLDLTPNVDLTAQEVHIVNL